MKREKKLAKNTAILTLGTVFSSAFSFFLIPLFSRWLSTEDYGTYDVYLTYVTLLIPVVTLAAGESAFRFLMDCKTDADRKKVLNCTWMLTVMGAIIGIIVAVVIFSISGLKSFIPFILLFISLLLFNQGNFIVRGLRKLYIYTFANIIYLIVMAVFVTLFVLVKGMGLDGILLGNACGHFAGFLFMVIFCKLWKLISFEKPDFREAKKIVEYSAPLIPNSISWWIVNVSDRSIINVVLGASFNGIYAIAYKLPSLCSTVFGVFHMSWLESAVDTLNDDDRNEYTNGIFNKIIPFCFSAVSCVLAVNRYFYLWIWDSKYYNGIVYVWMLLAGMCFSFLAQFLGGILIAEKRTKANGFTTIFAAVINIIVHVVLIKFVGLYAAAFSTFFSYFCLFIIRIILLKNRYQLRITGKSIIALGLFAIVVVLQYTENPVIGVLTLIVACIVSIILNKDIVMGIVNKFLRKKR